MTQVDELELELLASSAYNTAKLEDLENKISAYQGTVDDLVKDTTSYDIKINSL